MALFFWTRLYVMVQAEAEPVMSEMENWACRYWAWAAAQLLGIPSPLHQSLKGSSKPVSWLAEVTNIFKVQFVPGVFSLSFLEFTTVTWAYFMLRSVMLRCRDSLGHLVIWWVKLPKTMLCFLKNLPCLQIFRMLILLTFEPWSCWWMMMSPQNIIRGVCKKKGPF